MHTSDFDYELPEALIAQEPLAERDSCRLLCLDRCSGRVAHRCFTDLLTLLRAGDRLVFNDTKVVPARLLCRKSTGAQIEVLVTEPDTAANHWKALVKPARRTSPGTILTIDGSDTKVRIESVHEDGGRTVALCDKSVPMEDVLERYGVLPLPYYIKREVSPADRETYQTVYARDPGAIAAPTAGLHFTERMLDTIKKAGVDTSFVTLHVGIGTFRPVKVGDPLKHPMHSERFVLSGQAADEIEQTRHRGGRIIAVGTTVVRVLEHCASLSNPLIGCSGTTKLLIVPPYSFKVIDGLITNFHLPRSTLLMLVCRWGPQKALAAYHEAVARKIPVLQLW